MFMYSQVTFPPPYFGYDFNWALFGYGYNAANLTHNGAISSEYVILQPLPWQAGLLCACLNSVPPVPLWLSVALCLMTCGVLTSHMDCCADGMHPRTLQLCMAAERSCLRS